MCALLPFGVRVWDKGMERNVLGPLAKPLEGHILAAHLPLCSGSLSKGAAGLRTRGRDLAKSHL